jgi:hypothetical protein
VFTGGPFFSFVIVTENAGVLPSERDRMLPDQVERSGTVVSILSKSFGYDRAADDEEDPKAGENDQGRPDQMSGIAQQAAHEHHPLSNAGAADQAIRRPKGLLPYESVGSRHLTVSVVGRLGKLTHTGMRQIASFAQRYLATAESMVFAPCKPVRRCGNFNLAGLSDPRWPRGRKCAITTT